MSCANVVDPKLPTGAHPPTHSFPKSRHPATHRLFHELVGQPRVHVADTLWAGGLSPGQRRLGGVVRYPYHLVQVHGEECGLDKGRCIVS